MMFLAADALFLLVVTLLVKPAGTYMARVFGGERTLLDPALRPIERLLYRTCGVDPAHEMRWQEYARAFVLAGGVSTVLLYLLLRVQGHLPLAANAAALTTPLTPDLAANTAVSFATTSTWQAYAGETTMTYLTQLVGLAAQNFIAGAAGLAVGIAFIRGLAREGTETIGNFWVDIVRSMLWVLLPISIAGALALVWQGVPMTLQGYPVVRTLDGALQTIATGPVAALELIKQLGTNGGGFFNANGAHPLENPTPLANAIELLAIAVLPAALTYTYGRMIGRPRDGWVLYGVMVALVVTALAVGQWGEDAGSPALARAVHPASALPVANMEGKEVRFGTGGSVLTAVITSGGATGSYNAMHDSFTPIGGAVPLANMLLGELAYGGLGTGIVSIVLVALLGLFITGLMIGRTPEFLGKTLGATEVKLIMLYSLVAPVAVLLPTALAVVLPAGRAGLTTNTGAHGFSEILFAFTSAYGNNGQSFAGLSANSPFYNVMTGVAMLLGRFALVIPALALAGRFAHAQRRTYEGALPTGTPLFGGVVFATASIVSALTFLPAFALGPLAEQLRMLGR
jgi:K+-transporting ATPase ATPase A chain